MSRQERLRKKFNKGVSRKHVKIKTIARYSEGSIYSWMGVIPIRKTVALMDKFRRQDHIGAIFRTHCRYRRLIREDIFGMPDPRVSFGCDKKARELVMGLCKRDPWTWICGATNLIPDSDEHKNALRPFVFTQDELDEKNPVKPFPRLPHLEKITSLWMENPLMVVAKSRKMMISWWACAMYLWLCQFHERREVLGLCKREDDSETRIIDRMYFLWNNQPFWMKREFPCERKHLQLFFPKTTSVIRGAAQGPDAFRSPTLSGIYLDEFSHLTAKEETLAAALPAIQGGTTGMGHLTIVSTPSGRDLLWRLAYDIGANE